MVKERLSADFELLSRRLLMWKKKRKYTIEMTSSFSWGEYAFVTQNGSG